MSIYILTTNQSISQLGISVRFNPMCLNLLRNVRYDLNTAVLHRYWHLMREPSSQWPIRGPSSADCDLRPNGTTLPGYLWLSHQRVTVICPPVAAESTSEKSPCCARNRVILFPPRPRLPLWVQYVTLSLDLNSLYFSLSLSGSVFLSVLHWSSDRSSCSGHSKSLLGERFPACPQRPPFLHSWDHGIMLPRAGGMPQAYMLLTE